MPNTSGGGNSSGSGSSSSTGKQKMGAPKIESTAQSKIYAALAIGLVIIIIVAVIAILANH